jgi:AcrR family transcriptional regulator
VPRPTPLDRIPKLLDAAAAAFVEHGFQRTQMDDVAERLGVSKGTIYRSVDSKEALFAAVLLWADGPERVPAAGLDVPAKVDQLAASITADLATAVASLELTAVLADRRRLRSHAALGDEIERLVTGLYTVMHARRTAIMVLDRCAGEIPELAAVWFGEGRYALVDLWKDYLKLRAAALPRDVDVEIIARTVVEIITTWAVKIPWDRAPRPYPTDTATACAAMVRNLITGGNR